MNAIFSRTLPILVLSGFLAAIQSAPAATNPSSTYPQIVRLSYVEGDVRVSRGKPADKLHEDAGAASTGWEQATADLPVESGYSIVTGKGRAEIELEDASVVYLADNSVLAFGELSATDGVPHSEMSLLSGTATLDVKPMMQGEYFNLTAPTDHVAVIYPHHAYVRVDSYLDAIGVTPEQDLTLLQPGMTTAQPQVVGHTTSYSHGIRALTPTPDPAQAAAFSEWDTWVAARVAARNLAMLAAMKDAGLTTPVPGLEELNGQGRFFSCAPYGTCWEPTNGWDGHMAEAASASPQPAAPSVTGSMAATTAAKPAPEVKTGANSGQGEPVRLLETAQVNPQAYIPPEFAGRPDVLAYMAAHPGAVLRVEDYTFACSPLWLRALVATDPVTGKEAIIASDGSAFDSFYLGNYPLFPGFGRPGLRNAAFVGGGFFGSDPWNWAVCHSGGWVRWQHRYVWVAGTKRHHHRPIRWVKCGHRVGFVPLHPRDVAGKRPINLKDGVMRLTGKKGMPIEKVTFDEGKSIKLLTEPPREFRKPTLEPLKGVEAPLPMAYSAWRSDSAVAARRGEPARGTAVAGGTPVRGTAITGTPARPTAIVAPTAARGFDSRQQGTPIAFDHRSQSFSITRQVNEGGRAATVVQQIGGGYRSEGNAGSSAARASNSGGYQNSGSSGGGYQNSSGASRSYTPSSSSSPSSGSGGSSRSYTPPSSGSSGGYSGGGGGGYSRPSAPAPSYSPPPPPPPPPAPAPSFSGGGGSSGGSSAGGSHH